MIQYINPLGKWGEHCEKDCSDSCDKDFNRAGGSCCALLPAGSAAAFDG